MLRSLAKDTFVYGGGDLVLKLMAFVTFPIIAAVLSPKAFGALELLGTSTALLGLFVSCGLNNAVQRFYWDKDTLLEARPVIVSSGFAILLFFGFFVSGLVLVAVVPFFTEWTRKADLPMGGVAFVSAVGLMLFAQLLQYILDVLRLHFAPFKFLLLSFLHRVLGLLLGLAVVVWLGKGVDGLLFVQVLVACAVLPLGLWLIRTDLTPRLDLRGWGRQLIVFGYPFIFAGLAYWLFGSMDRWMLAAMTSVEEVGIYSIAFRFSSIVMFVNMAFGQAWSPYAIKVRTDFPETYRAFYARVLLVLLFCMLAIGGGVALFSGEVIGLLMPAEYAGSALPLSILCLGIVLQGTQQITAVGISLEKKTFLFARMAWATAFVNLAANWLLIPRFGAAGAAWGTCISYLVLTSGYLYYTQKLHPLPILWRKLGWLLLLGSVVFIAAFLFNSIEWNWKTITLKLTLSAVCLILGWPVLEIGGRKWMPKKENKE